MKENLHNQQEALRAGIQRSDARARQHSEERTLHVVRQYDLILSFLQRIQSRLDECELNMFYFPVKSDQLLCVYRTADATQPVPVEIHPYNLNVRAKAREFFDSSGNQPYISQEHPPLQSRRVSLDMYHTDDVLSLILAVLGGYLPRPYSKETASIVIHCPISEEITTVSERFRELTGVMILFGDKQLFSVEKRSLLAEDIKKEFASYIEEAGKFAIREVDFFISSLMNQDERIQDNQNRALGFIAHMLVHRFRNLRQATQIIVNEFPKIQDVYKYPQIYEDSIEAMNVQLLRAEKLEKQLEYIGQRPSKEQTSVEAIIDIFKYVLSEATTHTPDAHTVFLESIGADDLLHVDVASPPDKILEEVFFNHLENMLRTISQLHVEDRRLTQRFRSDPNTIYMDLINYGPPLPPDVLEDLQRTVRVKRPGSGHSGLGMFLSAMILRHAGCDQEIVSPLQNSNKGVCVTLKFPRWQ